MYAGHRQIKTLILTVTFEYDLTLLQILYKESRVATVTSGLVHNLRMRVRAPLMCVSANDGRRDAGGGFPVPAFGAGGEYVCLLTRCLQRLNAAAVTRRQLSMRVLCLA